MTNFKEDPAKDINAEVEFTCPCGKTTNLDYIIKHERKVLIDFILESGLLEEKELEGELDINRKRQFRGYNTLARNIKAHLDELIKSNSV